MHASPSCWVARTSHSGPTLSRTRAILHWVFDSVAGIYLLVVAVIVLSITLTLFSGSMWLRTAHSYQRPTLYEDCKTVVTA